MKEYIEREAIIKLSKEIQDNFAPLHRKVIDAFIYNIDKNIPVANAEPVRHGYWTGIEGDVCSECGASLTEIMDADSYFAIGFNPNDLVACPFCGAKMDGGKKI